MISISQNITTLKLLCRYNIYSMYKMFITLLNEKAQILTLRKTVSISWLVYNEKKKLTLNNKNTQCKFHHNDLFYKFCHLYCLLPFICKCKRLVSLQIIRSVRSYYCTILFLSQQGVRLLQLRFWMGRSTYIVHLIYDNIILV